jgi:WD40 repeat protein
MVYARGWFQYPKLPVTPPEGAVADGKLLYFDGSFDRGTIVETSDAAVAGEVVVEEHGRRTHILGGRWARSWSEVDELPVGATRIGTGTAACPEWIEQLAFSPDGDSIAVGCSRNWAQHVVLWDVAAARPRHQWMAREGETLGNTGCGPWLSWGARGVVSAGRDRRIRIWDPRSGRLVLRQDLADTVVASAAAVDRDVIAVVIHGARGIAIYERGTRVRELAAQGVRAVRIAGGRIAMLGASLRVHDLASDDSVLDLYEGIASFELLDDGGVLALLEDGRVIAAAPGGALREFRVEGEPLAIAVGGGKAAIVASNQIAVHVLATGALDRAIAVPPWMRPNAVAGLSPDGRMLAVGHGQRLVVVDLAGPDPVWQPLDEPILDMSADGSCVLTESSRGGLARVDLVPDATPHGAGAVSRGTCAASSDGRVMVEVERDRLRYLDEGGRELGAIAVSGNPWRAALAYDGSVVAICPFRVGVEVLDAGTGASRAQVGEMPCTGEELVLAQRADRGAAVISSSRTRSIELFVATNGAPVARWELDPRFRVDRIAISDDGAHVVTVVDGVLSWFDATSAAVRWTRTGGASALAIAPDGASLAIGTGGGVVWLDAASGQERARVQAHPRHVRHLAFRDDGALVSLGDEGSAVIWPASAARAQATPASVALREVLEHGARRVAEAAAAALAAESAPWSPTGERWSIDGHAALPGVDGRFALPAESPPWGELHRAGAWHWTMEQLDEPEPSVVDDDDDGEYDDNPLVFRLTVTDAATGAVSARQALPDEPEVHVNADGTMATLQGSRTANLFRRMARRRDTMGLYVVDHRFEQIAHIKPRGRIDRIEEVTWSPDGEVIAMRVSAEDNDRLELWRPRAKRPKVCAIADVRTWGFVGPSTVAVQTLRNADETPVLRLIHAHTGKPAGELAAGDVDRIVLVPPDLGAFMTVGGGRFMVRDESGTPLREDRVPDDAQQGMLSVDGAIWHDASRRWRVSDGAPLHDHVSWVVALAAHGDRLASLTDHELIVRNPHDGVVTLRGALPYDSAWSQIGQPGIVLLGDRLAVCAGEALRIVDLRDGSWAAAAPSGLVAVAAAAGRLITAHRRGVVRVWDPHRGAVEREIPTAPNLRRLAVDTALARVLIATDTAISLIAIDTGATLATVPLADPRNLRIALAPDGRTFAVKTRGVCTYNDAGTVLVARPDYGPETIAFVDVTALAIADGEDVMVIDPRDGVEQGRLLSAGFRVLALALDDQGRLVRGGQGIALSRRMQS